MILDATLVDGSSKVESMRMVRTMSITCTFAIPTRDAMCRMQASCKHTRKKELWMMSGDEALGNESPVLHAVDRLYLASSFRAYIHIHRSETPHFHPTQPMTCIYNAMVGCFKSHGRQRGTEVEGFDHG